MQDSSKKPLSEAQRRAVAKYNAKSYERIEMKVKKGEKAVIVAHAEKMGETLNGFLNRAVKTTMLNDSGEPPASGEESHEPAPALSEGAESTETE